MKIEPCHSFVVKAVFQLMGQIVFLGILLTQKEMFGNFLAVSDFEYSIGLSSS